MKIVVADRLDEETIMDMKMRWNLAYQPEGLANELAGADALVVRSKTKVTAELLAGAKNLRVVARAGVGLDNIDVKECEKKGIKVINTPGAPIQSVAELAIGLMLAVLRRIPRADSGMKAGKWGKESLLGNELFGKSVGLVGFGRIGRAVADRLLPFGVKLLVFDPHQKPCPECEFVTLEELLRRSDIVTLHAALVEETRGIMSRERIGMMKKSAILINTARGALVDEDALYDALKSGNIAGAGIDVYPQEPYSGKLCELENAVLLPHLGSSTSECMSRVGKELVLGLEEFLGEQKR